MALIVGDQYRKNPLSLVPGGCSVMVEFKDGNVLIYDNIKSPYAYIQKLMKNPDVRTASITTPNKK
jgi:hypothetical protein